MHYTTRLKKEIEIFKEFKEELDRYLRSDKFNGPDLNDKMVNRNDIFLRISECEEALTTLEYSDE